MEVGVVANIGFPATNNSVFDAARVGLADASNVNGGYVASADAFYATCLVGNTIGVRCAKLIRLLTRTIIRYRDIG